MLVVPRGEKRAAHPVPPSAHRCDGSLRRKAAAQQFQHERDLEKLSGGVAHPHLSPIVDAARPPEPLKRLKPGPEAPLSLV